MRLYGRQKMGYYPTPDTVTEIILSCLNVCDKGNIFRLLDPCCGEGRALSRLAQGLSEISGKRKVESYGIELDSVRYRQARACLTRAIHADALLEAKVSNKMFSLLFLNPPYDWTRTGDDEYVPESERYEKVFLKRYARTLVPNGVLILLIPYTRVPDCIPTLCIHFENIKVFRFPKGEYKRFRQVVIFATLARQRRTYYRYSPDYRYLDNIEEGKIPELRPNCVLYTIPPSNLFKGPVFESLRFDPEKVRQEIERHGIDVEGLIAPEDTTESIRPLMPLRRGHLALLLASGFMDGFVRKNGKRLLIKGFIKRIRTEVEEETEDGRNIIITERPVGMIRVLDFNQKKIFTVE